MVSSNHLNFMKVKQLYSEGAQLGKSLAEDVFFYLFMELIPTFYLDCDQYWMTN